MKPISINVMNIATRFIVTMFKFNIDDKASQFVTHKFRFFGVNIRNLQQIVSVFELYRIVRHRARIAGFRTLTEYVREASVNAEVVQNFVQEHNAVFRDLSGLCNNLNQITRLAHAQGFQLTEGALSDLLPQVLNLITHLHKEMKRQK